MALPTRVNHGGLQKFDPFELAQSEFDSMLNRLLGGRGYDRDSGLAPFGVDVREDAEHIYVEADLPGFSKEDVDITFENQTLTITAERKEELKDGKQKKGDL